MDDQDDGQLCRVCDMTPCIRYTGHGRFRDSAAGSEYKCCRDGKPNCKGHHVRAERPLSEPPTLNYDDIIENKPPSDLRFSKPFPGELEKWMKVRDTKTEELVLGEYRNWLKDVSEHRHHQCPRTPAASSRFYDGLWAEVQKDSEEVQQDVDKAMQGSSSFGRWEWVNLNQDGGTTGIEAWTAR